MGRICLAFHCLLFWPRLWITGKYSFEKLYQRDFKTFFVLTNPPSSMKFVGYAGPSMMSPFVGASDHVYFMRPITWIVTLFIPIAATVRLLIHSYFEFFISSF